MSLYLLIVTIVVPDVTIFIFLLPVRDLTSIFEASYIIYGDYIRVYRRKECRETLPRSPTNGTI